MKITTVAKDIRDSLKHQPAYLNQQLNRARIYDAKAKRDGTLQVKLVQHTPGQLGHGRVAWVTVRSDQSVSIYAGTVMEELLTVNGI